MLALYFFITQIGAGALLAMAVVPVLAGGRLYLRFGAALAASLIALGLGVSWWGGGVIASGGHFLQWAVGILLIAAGLFHVARIGAGFVMMLAGTALALAGVASDAWLLLPAAGAAAPSRIWFVLDAVAGGLVSGSVLMAMVLGHYYLNIAGLPVRYLERLTLLCMGAIFARAAILGITLTMYREAWLPIFGMGAYIMEPTLDPFPAVLLILQILAGILVPFVFCVMAWRSARIASTQSATGILYVALIVVMMGELAGRSLVAMTRLPI